MTILSILSYTGPHCLMSECDQIVPVYQYMVSKYEFGSQTSLAPLNVTIQIINIQK